MTAKNRKAFASVDFDMELGGQFLFSDHDSTKVAVYCRHEAAAEL